MNEREMEELIEQLRYIEDILKGLSKSLIGIENRLVEINASIGVISNTIAIASKKD